MCPENEETNICPVKRKNKFVISNKLAKIIVTNNPKFLNMKLNGYFE